MAEKERLFLGLLKVKILATNLILWGNEYDKLLYFTLQCLSSVNPART